MGNWWSFLGFLTIVIFIIWIFKIDKLHLKFGDATFLLNQFCLWLNSLFIIFFCSRSCRINFNFFLLLYWLNWLLCLYWWSWLNLFSNSYNWLSRLFCWLRHINLFCWRSQWLCLLFDNHYLTGSFCIWFLNCFHNFYLLLLCVSSCYWLFTSYLNLFNWFYSWTYGRLYNWLGSWLDNWLCWRFHLLLNSFSNWLSWSRSWSWSWLLNWFRWWSCLSTLLNLILKLVQLFWGKTCSYSFCLLRFHGIWLSTLSKAQGLLQSVSNLILACFRRLLSCLACGILSQWLCDRSKQFSRYCCLLGSCYWSRCLSRCYWCCWGCSCFGTRWLIHILKLSGQFFLLFFSHVLC